MKITATDIGGFDGKVVLATGASSGIGLAAALLFASKGAKVVIGDLRTSNEIPTNITFIKTDVTSWNSQLNLFKETIKQHGKVDVVLVNAGISEAEQAFEDRVHQTTGDPIEPTWSTSNVNFIGAMITTKLAMHFMRKQSFGGSIVLTGSRSSYEAYMMPVYSATKHGILGMMRALRTHTQAWNIRINMVAPGVTFTNITPQITRSLFEQAGLYLQTADEVALAIALLAQDSSFNGKTISISQGLFHELEDPIAKVRSQIYGEDDFEPKNEKELKAFNSAQVSKL